MAGSKSRLMLPYDKIFQSSCPGWAGLHATTIYRCPPHSITGSKSRTFISKGALIHHAVSSINLYKLGSWSQSRPYLFYPHFNNHLDLYRFSLFRWLWKCGCCLVSIIPAREGWVGNFLSGDWNASCFNHPNPRGLGLGSLHHSFSVLQFQSSQPLRVGSCLHFFQSYWFRFNHPNPYGLSPVYRLYPVQTLCFNHPNLRGLGLFLKTHLSHIQCFNHPNPQGLGQRCGRYIRSSTSFNHPSPRGLVVDTTFFVQQYTCVSIIPTHGGLGQLICNTLTSNQMFQSS